MSWTRTGLNDDFILRCLRAGKYKVDRAGRIWNMRFRGTSAKRPLASSIHPSGYLMCELALDGERHSTVVHRVVLLASAGKPSFSPADANHKNGNKADNSPGNLEWVTPAQNIKHAYATGLKIATPPRGEHQWMAKLTAVDVKLIFELRKQGLLQREIAERVGSNQSHVSAILRGKRWKHLGEHHATESA